jgi:hypothetical protein
MSDPNYDEMVNLYNLSDLPVIVIAGAKIREKENPYIRIQGKLLTTENFGHTIKLINRLYNAFISQKDDQNNSNRFLMKAAVKVWMNDLGRSGESLSNVLLQYLRRIKFSVELQPSGVKVDIESKNQNA